MGLSFNTYNKMYCYNSKQKNPSFGIKIPELESAIDAFVIKKNNTFGEEHNLIKKIKKFAKMIFQQESFIGSGSKNKVYDMGKYVFKIPKNVFISPKKATEEPLNLIGKIIKNENPLNIDSYCGESVLQIGNLKILRNIGEHIPCGVPYSKIDKMSKEDIENYYFENYFKRIIKVPQSSFDKFARDIKKIKYPATIDFHNPNNTAITKDNRIILIDDLLKYNKYCGENSTVKLLRIFMLDATLDVYTPVFDKHLNEVRSLFKKIILSGEKAGLLLSNGIEDKPLLNDALYKCRAKAKYEDFCQKIAEIRKSKDCENVKYKKIESYIDDIFKD